MPSLDAPDWETVVTTVASTGAVPDAPDFQTIVVNPGGSPAGGSGIPAPGDVFTAAGFTGITMWPSAAVGTAAIQSGRLFLFAFSALANVAITTIAFCVHTVGVPTTNECYVVIYNGGLGLVAQSGTGVADSSFASLGWQFVSPSTSPTLTVGDLYYVGVLFNGTGLQLYSAVGDSHFAINPQANTILYGQSPTSYTTPPASLASMGFTAFTPIMFVQ